MPAFVSAARTRFWPPTVNREEINEYFENQLREIRRANAKTRNFDANKVIDEDIAAGKTSHLMPWVVEAAKAGK